MGKRIIEKSISFNDLLNKKMLFTQRVRTVSSAISVLAFLEAAVAISFSNPFAGLFDTESSGTDNEVPYCVRTKPTPEGADVFNFLLVSDYAGVSYFTIDPHRSGPITDFKAKKRLVAGAPELPGGYAGAVAACCNFLYVAVSPPSDADADGVGPSVKPQLLQYTLAVGEDLDSVNSTTLASSLSAVNYVVRT